MKHPDYSAPSSDVIATRQNDKYALQLLITQRRLYTRAKRWQGLRWIGILVLGIGGPFVSLLAPSYAVAIGAIAGVWLFAGRTMFTYAETRTMVRAACVQEQLDQYLFDMPETIVRSDRPSLEDVLLLAGADDAVQETAKREKLLDWYPIDPASSGIVSIAIAQRSNAAYTDRLIRTTVEIWGTSAVVWLVVLILWASLTGMGLSNFLLGALFPVLPAFLDVTEYVLNTRRAAKDRADLASTITRRLSDQDQSIDDQDLLVWQERLFDLRRTTPQVPDWLYKLSRNRNEQAMNRAAVKLRQK